MVMFGQWRSLQRPCCSGTSLLVKLFSGTNVSKLSCSNLLNSQAQAIRIEFPDAYVP